MKKTTAALICCLLPMYAAAADWKLATTGGDGTKYFVDSLSIRVVGPYVKAWFLIEHSKDKQAPGTYPPKTFRSAKALEYFDCKTLQRMTTQQILYSSSGGGGETVSTSSAKIDPRDMEDVAPDTVAETMLEDVCLRAIITGKKK